jgi:hypothetical protein
MKDDQSIAEKIDLMEIERWHRIAGWAASIIPPPKCILGAVLRQQEREYERFKQRQLTPPQTVEGE